LLFWVCARLKVLADQLFDQCSLFRLQPSILLGRYFFNVKWPTIELAAVFRNKRDGARFRGPGVLDRKINGLVNPNALAIGMKYFELLLSRFSGADMVPVSTWERPERSSSVHPAFSRYFRICLPMPMI
jgi:hypothetical protein